ncbi:formate dehydrogenase [Effusibacillus lacus]|uniref:Formate dehydrogenase n=2 Tax=Effusibacillus lacus TaxID=1348429 RepID=A0A292YFU5_9BACL|nr:formate dehydrogenase [Effusibacillus lacus]
MGSNTTEAHPIIANRIKNAVKKGLQMIVIDPREIEMAKFASSYLQIKVGSDIALMNGMLHVIIKEGLFDPSFVRRTSTGFEDLKKKVEPYTPEYAASITGLTPEQIISTARTYARAQNAMIAYTLGITEHHCGVNNVFDIANLALLTGHIGRRGNGILPLRGQNNVQGAGDMGCLPNQLPGAFSLANDEYRSRFEKAWNVRLNPMAGATQTRIFEKMESGEIKALYIIGENPLLADVHMNHTHKLLKNLDLLVVQDIFLTETARMADVVLPARSWGEVEGTYTNTERRVQRVRKAVEPGPSTRDDWDILCDLSTRLGYPMQYRSSEEIWEEVRQLAPEMYGGMSYSRLDREGGLCYPCPSLDHPGTTCLHERFHKPALEGPAAPFIPVDYTPPAEVPDEEYPFMLTTGRRYELYNTHTQTRYYADGVKLKQTEETLDIHPTDAASLGIGDGDRVEVSSRRGKVSVTAKLTDRMQPGLVFMSFHWADVPTNVLTINEYDPISGTAEFKACAVKIAPATLLAE